MKSRKNTASILAITASMAFIVVYLGYWLHGILTIGNLYVTYRNKAQDRGASAPVRIECTLLVGIIGEGKKIKGNFDERFHYYSLPLQRAYGRHTYQFDIYDLSNAEEAKSAPATSVSIGMYNTDIRRLNHDIYVDVFFDKDASQVSAKVVAVDKLRETATIYEESSPASEGLFIFVE